MKIARSFTYAFKGIKFGLEEHNMKFHIVIAVLVVALGWFMDISLYEWIAVTVAIGLVLAAELFNTALEKVCDMVTSAHPASYSQAGKPKDIGAGAVLVAAITAVIIGLIVFVPHFVKL